MDLEKRITALEIAVQELLEGNRSLRYIDGVLCERKPYSLEWTPVSGIEWRRLEITTEDEDIIRQINAIVLEHGLTRKELALLTTYLRVRPGFSLADFDT